MHSNAKHPRAALALLCVLILATLFILISAEGKHSSHRERTMKREPLNGRMSRNGNHLPPQPPSLFRRSNEDGEQGGDQDQAQTFHKNLTELLKDPVSFIVKVAPMFIPCPKTGELKCIGMRWRHSMGPNCTADENDTPVPQVRDSIFEGEHHGHGLDRMHEDRKDHENTKVRRGARTLLGKELNRKGRDDKRTSRLGSGSDSKNSALNQQQNLGPVRRVRKDGSGHHGHGRGIFVILDGTIDGFTYEEGVLYKLNVSVQAVDPNQVSDYSTLYIMPRPPHDGGHGHGHGPGHGYHNHNHNHSESDSENTAGEDQAEEEVARRRRRRQYAGMRNLRMMMKNPGEKDAQTSELPPLPPPEYVVTVVVKLNEIVFQEALSLSDVPVTSSTTNPESVSGNAAGLTGSSSSALSGLSAGAIAGIVIAAVVVAGVVAAAAVFGMRRRGNSSGIGASQGHQAINDS